MTIKALKKDRDYTSKQMGDAGEMIVAAELTLAGIPALKVPDNWPHYDVIAQPKIGPAQRISVKSRTYKKGGGRIGYNGSDAFDWLAIVLLENKREGFLKRKIYIIPKKIADEKAYKALKAHDKKRYDVGRVEALFSKYENNFSLIDKK